MEVSFLDSNTISLNNDINFRPLESLGNYRAYKFTNRDNIISSCRESEVIIVNKLNITKEIIGKLPKLKLICVIATGYNNIDIKAARDRGVCVANVPNYAGFSVPQHTFALILNLATKVYLYNEDIKKGEWERSQTFNLLKYPTFELAGKTIGIIGFGAIGKGTARIAEGFGMKVMVHNTHDISDTGYKNYLFDEVLENADIVTIHCPLTKETKDLIGRKAFKKMKKTAILINTARGGIVNEKDLADALNSQMIAGAGVDVLTEEPPLEGNPLLGSVRNLILSPHSAWSTKEARQRLVDITAKNIKAYLKGEKLNLVS